MPFTATMPIARLQKSRLYVGLSLLSTVIVLVGFWSSYYGLLLRNAAVDRPVIVHIHAALFMLMTAAAVSLAIASVARMDFCLDLRQVSSSGSSSGQHPSSSRWRTTPGMSAGFTWCTSWRW